MVPHNQMEEDEALARELDREERKQMDAENAALAALLPVGHAYTQHSLGKATESVGHFHCCECSISGHSKRFSAPGATQSE